MIKTKTYTEHKICCSKCGGDIKIQPFKRKLGENAYARPVMARENPFVHMNDFGYETITKDIPTCQKCKQQYEISFNYNNMTITMKEI